MSKRFDALKNNEKEIYELFYNALKSKKPDILILSAKLEGISLINILIAVLRDNPEIDYVKYDLKTSKELMKTRIAFYYKEVKPTPKKEEPTPIILTSSPKPSASVFRLSSGDRHYYFSTLNSEEKIAYQNLLSAFKSFNEFCYVKKRGFDFDRLFDIFIGVLEDNPSVFYVDNRLDANFDDEYFIVKITYSIKKRQISEYEEKITHFLEENFSKYRVGYNDYQKALIIHDYIVENMKYVDDGKSIRHNVIGPIFEKVGVCEGFSELAKLIGDYIGINIQCIFGDLPDSDEGHMWNLVNVEGDWYHMDITYDLGNNEVIRVPHQYFLIPDEFAMKNHYWIKKNYPACNSIKNNYYVKEGLVFSDKNSLKTYIEKCMKNKLYETEFHYTGRGITMDDISNMALHTDLGFFRTINSVTYTYSIGDFSVYMIKWIVR